MVSKQSCNSAESRCPENAAWTQIFIYISLSAAVLLVRAAVNTRPCLCVPVNSASRVSRQDEVTLQTGRCWGNLGFFQTVWPKSKWNNLSAGIVCFRGHDGNTLVTVYNNILCTFEQMAHHIRHVSEFMSVYVGCTGYSSDVFGKLVSTLPLQIWYCRSRLNMISHRSHFGLQQDWTSQTLAPCSLKSNICHGPCSV